MTKATPHHNLRAHSAQKKKNDSAADELMKQVSAEKNAREAMKKKQAEEKRAEEEKKKKSDLEKAASNTATVSPPTTTNDIAVTSEGLNLQPDLFSDLDEPWTEAEDDDILTTHGISPNHLFGKEVVTLEDTPQETVAFAAEIFVPPEEED
jgi:hypothetical protein